jgi:hypothetical protein
MPRLGMSRREGWDLVWKVIDERDTPHGAAVTRALEQLAAIRI